MSRGIVLSLLFLLRSITRLTSGEETIRYEIPEEVASGTKVGNVVASSGIRKLYQKHELHRLEFRFLAPPPLPLVIGTADGVIRTAGVIDRDAVPWCRHSPRCDVNVDVTVQPVDYFRVVKVTVSIGDVNDNPPRFAEARSMLAILESAAVGSTFLLPSATDADSPLYGVARYELVSPTTKKFGLRVTPKLDGFLDVRLTLLERLDRETEDEYRMVLVAFDGGVPPKTDSLNVTAKVLDSNDNDPVFDRQNYDVSVVENTSRNVTIATVTATDADAGVNGEVVYGFSAQTEALYGRVFAVDAVTGRLTLKETVDRETIAVYQLIVTAEDRGPDSHPVDVSVTVTVEDANDNPPEITVNTLAAVRSDSAAVLENSPRGTFVAHVTVVDPDAGSNGTVSCDLVLDSTDDQQFFTLVKRSLVQQSETEYQVLTSKPLDREATPSFRLGLDCADHGTPRLRRTKRLPVTVVDENDNAPRFSRDVYRASIGENNYVGLSVVQTDAADSDADENARLRFSIAGDPSSAAAEAFDVNGRGLVFAKASVDREKDDSFSFYVEAVDGGTPARTGSALVLVNVEDANDEAPLFLYSTYSFTVRENSDPGTPVGETSAVDGDLPPFNAVRYAFLHENLATDCFFVDPRNGTVTTRCLLDREDQPVYHLALAAVDRGAAAATGSASLVVYVEDANDNAPYFDFPSPANDTVHVSSRAPVGHVVATVTARDRDEGVNAQIAFRLQSGNDDGMFHLDTVLGTVYVSRRLSDIDHFVYRLLLVAEDQGTPHLSASAYLNVVVNRSIAYHDRSSVIDSLTYHEMIMIFIVVVVVVVGAVCTLCIVCRLLWLRIVRSRRDHLVIEGHHQVKPDRRSEGVKMLQGANKAGGGGGSSVEGTPVKRPLVFNSNCLTNNNFDHLNHYERKSVSSADGGGGLYGDGCHGNSSGCDDDDVVARKDAIFRSSCGHRCSASPVTSSYDVWPLTTTSSPGYSTRHDRRVTSASSASRLRAFTLPPPQPPRSVRHSDVMATAAASNTVARQSAAPSGCHGNCFRRTEPVCTTNSLALLRSQHTLLI